MRKLLLLPTILLALSGCAAAQDAGDGVATAGGGATPAPSASTGTGDEGDGLKFAQCMRGEGLTWFEDPEPGQRGVRIRVPEGQDKAKVDAAMEACKQFLPNGGEPPKLDAAALEQVRLMAKCMRENGVPDFPDPGPNGEIRINAGQLSVKPGDPAFEAAQKACARYRPQARQSAKAGGA
jgi:hypothetical protein